jgi:uncharacterized membrane protein YbhN (UPF0104 family)
MKTLRWSGSILLLAWLLSQIDVHATLHTLASAQVSLLVWAFVVLMAVRVLIAWRWLYVLRLLGIGASFLEVFRITMVSVTLGLVMPGGLAAIDAYRTWSMSRLRGSMSIVTASVAADRVFGLYSLIAVSFLATLLTAQSLSGRFALEVVVSWAFATATVITITIVFLGPRLLSLFANAFRFWPRGHRAVGRIAAHLQDGDLLKIIAIPSTLMALPVQVLRGVGFYLVFKAIDVDIGLAEMLVYAPLVFTLMLLPVSVGGIGVREGSFYLLLSSHGVSLEAVVVAGALYHFLGILLGLPGGLWIARGPSVAEERAVR